MDWKLIAAQREFYSLVDHQIDILERGVPAMVCPPDCSACCLGDVFFVTGLDFMYACHYANQHLGSEERAHIIQTGKAQAERSGDDLALDLETSRRRAKDGEGQPCPFLAQGRCRIYPARPTPCRLYGRTRFGSGRPNLCDTIVSQLQEARGPAGWRAMQLPVVEGFSRMAARILRSRLGETELEAVERLLGVSTLPVFISRTELDEDYFDRG